MRFRSLSLELPDADAVRVEQPERDDIDWKLEDQAFKHLMPDEYRAVSRLVQRRRAEREGYTRKSVAVLEEALEEAGIHATVSGRTKHLYSIYSKLQRYHARGRNFGEIYDLTALRVIVNSVTDCYLALGVVHEKWEPVVEKFDDYIANPKANHYQSLHTSVLGPEGRHVEVQIRTREMHRIAEAGMAAHCSYRQARSKLPAAGARKTSYQCARPFGGPRRSAAAGTVWKHISSEALFSLE